MKSDEIIWFDRGGRGGCNCDCDFAGKGLVCAWTSLRGLLLGLLSEVVSATGIDFKVSSVHVFLFNPRLAFSLVKFK